MFLLDDSLAHSMATPSISTRFQTVDCHLPFKTLYSDLLQTGFVSLKDHLVATYLA
jgi:hypothetical protein